jgi:hypothetical protein
MEIKEITRGVTYDQRSLFGAVVVEFIFTSKKIRFNFFKQELKVLLL